jgi:alpha-N-arabinofuranosidase
VIFVTTHPATIGINRERIIGEVSPMLFGSFAEHMGRCIYQGIYDPDSPHANAQGFRTDVLSAMRELGVSILRYPGGNFVCTYDWKDGVGPRSKRPSRRELAWRQIEHNDFGIDEFIDFCREVPCEPMLSVNLSTDNLRSLSELVEYCNAPAGTHWADYRIANGHREPHEVRNWCLGNEVDGPWQIGQTDAITYGHLAREAAKIIKRHDAKNQTILCGSSAPDLPTYPAWDSTVLDIAWEQTDFLAMHHYATNWENDTPSFLAYGIALQQHIDTIAASIRQTKTKKQSKHDVKIAWDEWNVWYKDRSSHANWTTAARLCEETYNLEDALVIAQWFNLFLRRCDVLKIACLAQIVNVIAPLKTTPSELLKETIFYPLVLFAQHARGQALDLQIQSPTYSTIKFGDAPLLDAAATFDVATNKLAVFLVNRSMSDPLPVQISCEGTAIEKFDHNSQIAGRDPKAINSLAHPDTIIPHNVAAIMLEGRVAKLVLPPLSFTVLSGIAKG